MKHKFQHIAPKTHSYTTGSARTACFSCVKSTIMQGAFLLMMLCFVPVSLWGQAAASTNYTTVTGSLGSTYSWIDCSAGTGIISGDDVQASISWPFTFSFYDNTYTTADYISVASNGFIRLDGTASTDYTAAQNYNLSSSSVELGQIIATSVYDCNIGGIASSWAKYVVTGSAPNRILTIEFRDIEIDYNDLKYADIQVSFYETGNKVVLKFGADNITVTGADMGIHSGVAGYYHKWQEVLSGTNNAWIEYTPGAPAPPSGPAASWNYITQTGTVGTTYGWIDCSAGTTIVSGDDAQAQINWPFNFNFYDNIYTTLDNLSVCTNGFIRLDGVATTDYATATNYDLTSTATNLGQVIAMAVYDGKVGDNGGWVRYLVTGTAPTRVFTIEYNNLEIDYNDNKYADVQVSFYESSNKLVLKFGTDDLNKSGVDMGLHSGVNTFFNKWQEVLSGTTKTWIEYIPPYVEVNATSGNQLAYYATLKDAFDQINNGKHQQIIALKIRHNTTETAPAVLNASGTGSANYAIVNLYPTKTGVSISGDLASPLIDLNGADNITIDGRVNGIGSTKSLSIINTNLTSVDGTSTIRFINDASNNTIKYCNVKGSETAAASGVILFSTTIHSTGNDGNTVIDNNITSLATADRPSNAIFSSGTLGKDNSGNIISNNSIFDFLKQILTSNGIFLSSNTTAWTISGNSFYETSPFISTGTDTYNVIKIDNTSGNGFVISDNYIGGSTALCGGTAWTKTNSTNNIFNAISINVGTTVTSTIQNNTIRNFIWGNSGNAAWTGISVLNGNVNLGTVTGNSIGHSTGTGSITITGGTSGQSFYGINIAGSGSVNCSNNTIGSITVANTNATNASNFYGINRTGTSINDISNNTIGSNTQANSVLASSPGTGNAQSVYGIRNATGGTITCSNNTIANLNNATTNTTIGTPGVVNGISSSNGTITISNNAIYGLSIGNANTNAASSASICGIALTGTTAPKIVTGNTIYNLSNTFVSFAGHLTGLYYEGSIAGTNTVSGNIIHSLAVTGASATTANIYGFKIGSGVTTYSNNIISIGGNTRTTVYGIYETGAAGNNNNLYFNTVYIYGSLTSGSTNKSYAFYSAVTTNVRNIRNNIFVNARSTTSGSNLHYAAYFNYAISTNLTVGYNNYFISGTGGVLGYYGTNKTALPIISGQDAGSLSIDPVFSAPGGINALDYFTATSLPGETITGINTDYDGVIRGNPPKMGALEFSLDFVWQGNTSTNFGLAANWQNGSVPPNGAKMSFATTPANDCHLDQNRTLNNITNTSVKKLFVNGKQLTLTGDITSAAANQIDATTTSSVVIFAGSAAQNIPADAFVSNTFDGLTINNSNGLIQNSTITVQTNLTLTNGAFAIGANTLTINGSISTASGNLTGGSSSNVVIGGSGASTILPAVVLNNLTLNRANGISLGGSVSVAGTLALTDGVIVLGANTLTISGGTLTRTSGSIDASNASASLKFTNASAITLPASVFTGDLNNLDINGAGITAADNFSVNGILNLQSANPSATKGSLDMSTYTLNMGGAATTTGIGDVTGIIKREHTFLGNVGYSFGNQYTSLTFVNTGTKPGWVSCKVTIGSTPAWRSEAVKREYSFTKDAGTDRVIVRLHYLDSELYSGEPDESQFVLWDHHNLPTPNYVTQPHGKSSNNPTNNWVERSGMGIGYLAPSVTHDDKTWGLSYSDATRIIWTGLENDGDWSATGNWNGGVPTSSDDVLIPAGLSTPYPYTNLFPGTVPAVANTIEIEPGASVTVDSYDITVYGSSGAWINNGTFVPGTGTVVFDNTLATISGITDFYDVTINTGKSLRMEDGCVMRITGAMQNDGDWHVVTTSNSTVEYNGGNQIVVSPNSTTNRYNDLVLSGTGTKTMPITTLNIEGEFVLEGPVTATAQSTLNIGSELEIIDGATFATGAFDHFVGGNFDVGGHLSSAGTFTPTAGYSITLNGTGVQNIYGGSIITFEDLIIDNSAGVDLFDDITIDGDLTLTSGNLNLGAIHLTINGDITKTSGFINTATQSLLTFGGTTGLTLPGALFFTTPSIQNLTINRTGGVIAGSDITVNGILDIQSANPSAIIGGFSTGNYTLNMGATATTIGIGEVTGKIKRTTILANTEYTYGSQFSSVTFPNIGTLPSAITLKVDIGTAPAWKPDGIKRIYDISQVGGNGTKAVIKSHYLDSELNGLVEEDLGFFSYSIPSSTLLDRGLTEINTTDNWITLSNTDFENLPPTFGIIEHGFGVSISNIIIWDGSESADWFDPYNWLPALSPDSTKIIVIPDATTTLNDPVITAGASDTIYTLTIQPGGVLSAGANTHLFIKGSAGAWSNYGTYNPSTGKVIFAGEDPTISGITNFFDITTTATTELWLTIGSTMRIAGTMHNEGIWHTVIGGTTTIEYNGGAQTVVIPNPTTKRYNTLILSGSGTKTMPASTLHIIGDFTIAGTASVTAADTLKITGSTTISAGATFETGSNPHFLGGNFENNGTFTSTAGGTVIFNGTAAQTISGSSAMSYYNLTTDNVLGITQASDIDVNNVLELFNGSLNIGANTLGINGTISAPSGNINANNTSSLSFGGTTAITLNNYLFNGNPTINNLTINRSGGVTLGNESITVNGTVVLSAGTLTLGMNTLTIAGNSITRTSGNIDAGNSIAQLIFTNTSAVTLPPSVFTGSINHLTIIGAGINAGDNISINGILSLSSANQSADTGSLNMRTYTLNMGASATSTGLGDVTGIVKREHTFLNGVEYSFGNQYTTLNFLNVPGSTKPTWVSCKIEIGTAPTWRGAAIKRFYSFAQSGGNDRMIVKLHYLDSELHGTETDETQLVFWDAYDPALGVNNFVELFPRNHNGTDAGNNWIQLTGPAINYLATSSVLDVKQWGLSYSNVTVHTWIGLGSISYPGDWSLPGHWNGGVPQAYNNVLIPATLPSGSSGYPYRNLLPVISPSVANSIEIESGASLSAADYNITVYGDGNAWINNGNFIPGSGNVIFANGDENNTVLINGTTDFNDLTITNKTHLHLATSSITRIAGLLDANIGAVLDFTTNTNLVEYNGNSPQTVINPTGDSNPGYHDLILSGSGTKTLAVSKLNIEGDLTFNATISATGDTLVMNGTDVQNISGSVAPALNDFQNANTTATVTAGVHINCSGNFSNTGVLDMTTYNLGITGTVTNSGTTKTASTGSTPLPTGKTWDGTVQYYFTTGGQTVMAGTYNNLTLSNTSGTQSASGNLTVNATLTTTSGGLLDMGGHQLLGNLSSISNGGSIQTQNTSSSPIPTGKTWGGTIKYNTTAGGQTIEAGTYNTLDLSNTAGTQTAIGDISAATLNTISGGIFDMVTFAISGLTSISNLGTLRTQNTSSSPFTSGLSWGGTVVFDGSSGQTLPSAASTFNNLSISNTAGVTAAANQTVNGILNLSVANPDATHGSLDMGTYALTLGSNANTTGIGDVTGTITRNSFTTNTIYTYGNANQYVFFPVTAGQTLPTSFSLRVTLLATAPTWVPNATKRLYEIAQTGGANTKATFMANYLDAELASGVDESLLSFWQDVYPFGGANILERGWSDYNLGENWITFSDANFGLIPGSLGYFMVTIAPTQYEFRTWNGSQSTTNWNTATNWTPQGVPTSSLGVVIPDVSSSNSYSPDLPVGATGKYLIIKNGGILNTITDATFILSGNGNVWSIEQGGLFNPGNSVVNFDGDNSAGMVGIAGYTDFYDLTISANTTLKPGVNAYLGIAGTLNNNGVLDAAATHNTIEFKKDDSFTLPNPNGSTPGYHTLIISGTGTKTLPTPLDIWHDFTNNGTVETGTGLVKINGAYNLQTIGGSSSTNFYDLTIDNTSGTIQTAANITVDNTLTVNAGATFQPGAANTVGGTGTLTGAGTVKVTRITSTPDFATQYPITSKTLTNLTVNYCGAGDQTVSEENYSNLIISPNGARNVTFSTTGPIGVSNVFNPDVSATTYTITGSTLIANGTGSQTVPAFNYYNVIVSGDRGGNTITLANGGTIGIAGHSTVSATNANFVITNNTIDINGSQAQTIDPFSFYNVIFSNSGTKTTTGNLVVYGGLTINSGTTLDMAAYTLSGQMGVLSNNGTIKTANTSAAPIPAGRTWAGTIEYTGSAAQTVVEGTYNNLTMSGAGGGTAGANLAVNGVLNLSHANPSSTLGVLHTGGDTINMGALATTTGTGDVTGIVRRQHTFANGLEYCFGNPYTSLNFLNVPGSTKPTWVICKIAIGTAPTWRSEAINRFYSFAQTGGTDRMIVKLHYLDSELHGAETDETKLVFWDAYDPALGVNHYVELFPRNHNDFDATNNWIQLTGPAINYIATSSLINVKQWGLGYTNVSKHTWVGLGSVSYPGDWSLPGHWDGGVPQFDDEVLIPATLPAGSSGYPSRNLLPVISPASARTIEIEAGGTLNVDNYAITISGDADAWINSGTFNAGSGTVIFNHGSTGTSAEINGTTNFNNLSVGDNTKIQAAAGSIIRVGASISPGSGSVLDFNTNTNTVEYNGSASQNVLDPGTSYGYHNLIFSGIGTKILPSSTLNIFGDLTVNSAISVTGNTLAMKGSTAQIIDGTDPAALNNLTIDNASGVTLDAGALATIRGILLINSGKLFKIAATQKLSLTGSITNNAGNSGLILHSDATGTASLLHNTSNVPATFERYISGADEAWHFLSSPVSNQSIGGSWLPSGSYGNGTGYDLYLWNEPTSCWIYKLNTTSTINWNTLHPGTDFVAGRGYLYSVEATNPTKEFTGELNNGSISYGLTYASDTASLKGFNLVGNPYPSSIDWMAASGWTRNMLEINGGGNNMWIWNPAANNYGVYNSADPAGVGTNSVGRYIAPMQGYFVRASSAGNLSMNNNVRVHDGAGTWFKQNPAEISKFSLSVISDAGHGSDEIRLNFGYPANENGAQKLFSKVLTAPSIYMTSYADNLSISYFTNTEENPVIPVGFLPGASGDYTISCNFDFNNFDIVMLEDRKTRQFQNLKSINTYRFNADKRDDENRFVLHFGATDSVYGKELPAKIYTDGTSLIIDLTLVTRVTTLTVCDVTGKILLKEKLTGETQHNFNINANNQILIVYLENPAGSIGRKIFWRKH